MAVMPTTRTLSQHQRSPLDGVEWMVDVDRTEERCRSYLESLRWPDGICCPRCDERAIGTIPARKRFYCRACLHHFSVTSGTVFHNSHLPIWKWFLAVELLLNAETGLPANQLVRLLGGSYKTSWFVEHRIRAAIVQAGEHPVELAEDGPANVGAYRPGPKYLQAYLAESSWRERSRGNPEAFCKTVEMLLAGEPVPYGELIGERRSRALRTLSIS